MSAFAQGRARARTRSGLLAVLLGSLASAALCLPSSSQADEIFWANSGNGSGTTIGKATIDGSGSVSNLDHSFITGLNYPRGVAANSRHLYWSQGPGVDSPDTAIGQFDLLYGGFDPAFIRTLDCEDGGSLRDPRGIAIDSTHIYWLDAGPITIGRANLDGTEVKCQWADISGFNPGAAVEQGVAVDDQYVYWTQTAANPEPPTPPSDGRIGRVTKADPMVIDENYLSPLGRVDAIATGGEVVWWYENDLDSDLRGICSSDYFPTPCPRISLDSGSYGLALTGDFIYFTSFQDDEIGRVRTDGSGANESLITGADDPWGVAVRSATPIPAFTALALSTKAKRVKVPRKGKKRKVKVMVQVTNSGDGPGSAIVSLRSSSAKVKVPRQVQIETGAGSSAVRSFKATVLHRAPRKATLTAKLPGGQSTRLVLKLRR